MDAQITPTPYRLAKHQGDIDAPEISQTTRRYAYRLVGVVEGMRRRDEITKEQWEAYQQFEKYAERAAKLPPCVGGYRMRVDGGGGGFQDDPDSDWGPLDHMIRAHERTRSALHSVGGRHAEALLYCALNPTNLETVGRTFGGETNKAQAIAVGREILKTACERLTVHYGYINTRGSPKAA